MKKVKNFLTQSDRPVILKKKEKPEKSSPDIEISVTEESQPDNIDYTKQEPKTTNDELEEKNQESAPKVPDQAPDK